MTDEPGIKEVTESIATLATMVTRQCETMANDMRSTQHVIGIIAKDIETNCAKLSLTSVWDRFNRLEQKQAEDNSSVLLKIGEWE